MSLTNNLVVQVYPKAGDTQIKNLLDNSVFTGTGSPVLIDEGSEKAWQISTGTLLKAAIPSRVINVGADGNGVTIAMRFKRTATGTDTYAPMTGVSASTSIANGVRFTGYGNAAFRGRFLAGGEARTTLSAPNNSIVTLVYRAATLQASATAPNMDTGAIWQNRVGRVGTDPEQVTYTNYNPLTVAEAFINAQTDTSYILLDFAYWDRELTDAECTSVADNYRAVMPAPGAPPASVPVSFNGSVPNQTATVGTPFSLGVASYFGGNLTPFTYAQLGDALTGTGLSFAGSTISGTPTAAAVLSKQVRATDTGSNIATTNTFTITISELPPPPPTGTPAQDIPSTGTDGPALLYKDIALVGAQPTDVMRAEIIVPPSVGTLTMNADSSFTYTGPSTTFTYEGFINDVSYGTGVVTLTTGG